MTKDQLSKLAALNNPESNKFLVDFANKQRGFILEAKSNEDIITHLDYFDILYHKVPELSLELVQYLISRKPFKAQINRSPLGDFEGTSYSEVLMACVKLLTHIRYYNIDITIKIAFNLSNNKDQGLASSAIKLLEDTVEYNHSLLPKIGITPQFKAINFIEKNLKDPTKQKKHISFITTIIKQVFETSSRSTSMTSVDTMTFSSGDIPAHPNIAKIRRKALKYILSVYKSLESVETKLSIFSVIKASCSMPMNGPNNGDLGILIQEDRKFALNTLKKIFLKDKKVIEPFAVCLELESLLYWFFINQDLQKDIATKLIDNLHSDKSYDLFTRFVYDDRLIHIKNKTSGNYENPNYVDEYISKISNTSIEVVYSELNKVAEQAQYIDEWKVASLRQLLEKFSINFPQEAFKFVKESIKKKSAICHKYFLPNLLSGLRQSKISLWDELFTSIVRSKDYDMIISLIGSLFVSTQFNEDNIVIREKEDINILSRLVKREEPFSFLKKTKSDNLLSHFTINSLRKAYKTNPQKVEALIIKEIGNNPDYFLGYLQTITVFPNEFSLKDWSKKGKLFFINKIIDLVDVDWHIQDMLPYICENPEQAVGIFLKRIKLQNKKSEERGKGLKRFSFKRYDPIPHHMSSSLNSYLTKGNQTKIINLIARNLPSRYGVDSMELAQLVQHLNITPQQILKKLSATEKVSDSTVKKVLISLPTVEANDPDFLVELSGKTSNKDIHREIYSRLSSTGVVSGEFGISEAYKAKRLVVEKYKNSRNKNIKKFATMAIEWLKDGEERAYKDSLEQKEKRRIEFETH